MARDYASEYQALLPSGAAWPRAADSVSTELARGLTKEFERVDERAAQLLLEMDPRTTTELIDDWERVTGLPDPCAPSAPTTLEARRAVVVARLLARGAGGPSVTFLAELIVALGIDSADLLIRRFHRQPFTCDSACTDALDPAEVGWPYVWEVIVEHSELDASIECQLRERYALAHLALTFAFPLFNWGDGSFTRAGSGVLTNPESGEQTTLEANELGTFYFGV
jgi:uncharacterized protein YmfQ (DUF2313 family)